jgi:hypothetical protein
VNEHILAAVIADDEAEALLRVEEFDDAFAFADDLRRHSSTGAATGTTATEAAATTAAAAESTATAAAITAATAAVSTAAAAAVAAGRPAAEAATIGETAAITT